MSHFSNHPAAKFLDRIENENRARTAGIALATELENDPGILADPWAGADQIDVLTIWQAALVAVGINREHRAT